MTTGSLFVVVLFAVSGGVLVFVGLLMERFSEKDWHKNLTSLRHWKSVNVWGEWTVIAGIVVEIGVGIFSAVDAWQTRQMAIKNDPLLQPVTQVSATLLLTVDAATYTPQSEQSMQNTFFNFSSGSITNSNTHQVFALGASEGRYFEHTYVAPNGVLVFPKKIVAYTIALRFEQPALPLPTFQAGGLPNTNYLDVFPEIAVTNALMETKMAEVYIDFLPTNTAIIRGKATLSVNGFRMDFNFRSNSINREMSEYNPDRKGIFLESDAVQH